MTHPAERDQDLLAAFAATFVADEYDPYGSPVSPPMAFITPPEERDELAGMLRDALPPLYERLVLSYRWPFVETPLIALLANPPGSLRDGLLAQIEAAPEFRTMLAPAGYIPFGRGSGGSYDPVCFDTKRRLPDGDSPVVRIDHEQILCHFRIRVVTELAESFRSLLQNSVGH